MPAVLLDPQCCDGSDAEADGCDRRAARVEECETNLDKWRVVALFRCPCRQTKDAWRVNAHSAVTRGRGFNSTDEEK